MSGANHPTPDDRLFPNRNRRVSFGCFWPTGCSDSTRCNAHGSCVADAQARTAVNGEPVESEAVTSNPSPDPKPSDDRNGCFLDRMWCCKVCDGEIPDGHTEDCDIWKLEKKHREFVAKEYNSVLTERDRLIAAIGEHVTVRSDQYAQIQRLRAALEGIRRLSHEVDDDAWRSMALNLVGEALCGDGQPNETGGEYARGRWEAMTEVAAWVDSRVEGEVTHRPDVNIYKRTLANTWGQMQRKLAELLGGEASRKPTADWFPSTTSETPWVAGPPTTPGSHVVHYESGYYAVLTLTPDSMVLRSSRDDNPYGIVRHFKFDASPLKASEVQK